MKIMIKSFFTRNKFDNDEYHALLWKSPDSINVFIQKDKDSYFAKLTNFEGHNVVTQARTGRELVEMVNAVMYDFLDIPNVYRDELGYFLPPEDVREEMSLEIPQKYLNKNLSLVKA
jgi:hypothetical protein